MPNEKPRRRGVLSIDVSVGGDRVRRDWRRLRQARSSVRDPEAREG
jgi:hypothetical protein